MIGDDDRPVSDDDLKQMPYLEMVFKEVLRLFPIGVMLQRTINEDINISKFAQFVWLIYRFAPRCYSALLLYNNK